MIIFEIYDARFRIAVCNSVSNKNIGKANPVNIGAKEIGSNPFAPTEQKILKQML